VLTAVINEPHVWIRHSIAEGRLSEATVDPNQWRQSSRSIYLHLACSSSYTITLHMIPPQTTKTSRRQPIPVMGRAKMRRITSAVKRQDIDDRYCVNQVKKGFLMRHYLFAAATLLISINPVIAQDAANGEDVFKKCRTCHQVGDSAKNSVGPILNGIIGRPAGTIAGFSYSPANKEAGSKGLVWSEDNLFKYLENPTAFMPKTKMIFPGVKDEQDRKDLIAYLKKFP